MNQLLGRENVFVSVLACRVNFFFNFQIHPIVPVVSNKTNHTSQSNITTRNLVCENCKSPYDDLKNAYDDVIKDNKVGYGDAEATICGDVSAAVSIHTFSSCSRLSEFIVHSRCGNTYLTSLPLVSVCHHGHVNQ